MALGGTCENNNNKLEVGPSDVILTDIGKKVFGGKDTLVSLKGVTFIKKYLLTSVTNIGHTTVPPRPRPYRAHFFLPIPAPRLNGCLF